MPVDTGKPAFVGLTNYAADATITPSEEATDHDAGELKVASYAETWRSTSAGTGKTLTFDLGASKPNIQVIVLWGVNLQDDATWQIETSDDSGFSPLIDDSGSINAFDTTRTTYVDDTPAWGRPVIHLPTSDFSGQYVRITLNDSGNPDGYLEAAHATIGPVDQAGSFMHAGWSPGITWLGPIGRSVAVHTQQLSLKAVTEDNRRAVLSVTRGLMGTGRFGWIPRTSDDADWIHEAFLGRLSSPPEEVGYFANGGRRWDITLQLMEITD